MAKTIQQLGEELANLFQLEAEQLHERFNALTKRQRVRLIAEAVGGLVFLLLLLGIFFRRPKLDQSAIDERVKARDAQIKTLEESRRADSVRYADVMKERDGLRLQNINLENAYISNQERHTIVKEGNEKITSTVRAINNRDSLRRAALGQ